jgi:hypothetical protein
MAVADLDASLVVWVRDELWELTCRVESLTECGFDKHLPDSTLYDFVGKFSSAEVAALRRQLHAQVRTDWRCKRSGGGPCGNVI